MRITEISNLEEAEFGTQRAKEITNTLKNAGYKRLGSGADASVWAKDAGSVIKILMPEEDDGYTDATLTFVKFYEYCISHKDNPCLPRFIPINGKDYTNFVILGKTYTQISMEKLIKLKYNSFEEAMVYLLSDLASSSFSWIEVKKELELPKAWFNYTYGENEVKPYVDRFLKLKPKEDAYYALLYTTMNHLYRIGRSMRFGWDLHTGNVMKRNNGELVIIDPWYGINI